LAQIGVEENVQNVSSTAPINAPPMKIFFITF